MIKALLPLGVAVAFVGSPLVAHAAKITSNKDFNELLEKKIGKKTGKAAGKAAAKVMSLAVIAKPKGNPKKIVTWTKLGQKYMKKNGLLTLLKDYAVYSKFWSKWVMFNYFKKGKIAYDPKDKKFQKAYKQLAKFTPPAFRDDKASVQGYFNQMKKNNKKLKGTDEDLGVLQDMVAQQTGTEPIS